MRRLIALGGMILALAACGRSGEAGGPQATAPASPLSERARLGRALFFDRRLSASGRMACATCHDPAHAYAPANDRAVQLGGPHLKTPGTRAVPSLMYKRWTYSYSDEYQNPDRVSPPAPGGGFGWDGRADTLAEQAMIPLFAANEMANASRAAVTAVLRANYGERFRATFGTAVFDDPRRALLAAGAALAAFQVEDRSFRPYRSRFDRFRNNKRGGTLTPQELRGFALYMDPHKGNCNACHLLGPGRDGSQDVSSDDSYAALGVPRNPEIPANADPDYYDLGLCGPLRSDHAPARPGAPNPYCGLFKVPVLRNVATRGVFMHNGRFKSLREAVSFYATRDSNPERWYPKSAAGRVRKFDDLPPAYRANLDVQMPLDGRPPGSAPALSERDIDDLVAFLKTLTDDGMQAVAAGAPR